jgi:hypothetical protein
MRSYTCWLSEKGQPLILVEVKRVVALKGVTGADDATNIGL